MRNNKKILICIILWNLTEFLLLFIVYYGWCVSSKFQGCCTSGEGEPKKKTLNISIGVYVGTVQPLICPLE